ncbi:MAG TPA: SRPBCC family protein [Pyrinomonadaceae bacterium]|jgi:uncharacterized protein YndB with AHSA1/START domain|nr:SRPBCC family protein [Pyrinomonadaceae bacterium]
MRIEHTPSATAEMLIRKPVAEVFEAFVNPAITTRFWFTKSSGRLETGKQIQWDWEMYNASAQVIVNAIEQNRRILVEWSGYGTTTIEWLFYPQADGTTFVSITNAGFSGEGDEIVRNALDSMGGFTMVLCGLKALLEHNIILNLIADRFPEGLEKS